MPKRKMVDLPFVCTKDVEEGSCLACQLFANQAFCLSVGGSSCTVTRLLKQHFRGSHLHSNEEEEVAIREWLRNQEPDFYRDGILNLCQDETNASTC